MKSESRATRLTRAFEQLSLDYRVTLQTFDSLLHTLQAAWTVGPSHALTETWSEYRTEFKDLHLRAQTNASRLAGCLDTHHKQLSSFIGERLSIPDKRARLEAFQQAVRDGGENALQIQRDYDALTVKVEAFPVLMTRDVSSWSMTWSRANSLCIDIRQKLTSLWDQFVVELILHVRRIVTAVGSLFGYSARVRLQEDSTESCEKTRPPPQPLPIADAIELAEDDSIIICDRLRGFEGCWAGLYIAIDRLELCVHNAKGMVGTLQLHGEMMRTIREVYVPVVEALNEFARAHK